MPHFIIIGTMKGGTTSLYRYISSHPDAGPSSKKETNFFQTNADFSKGLAWYKAFYKNTGKYCFEASPNYTKRHIFPDVAERMHSILPDTKLIYVLRDPIERIISHYIHNLASGRESRSFSAAIQDRTLNYYIQNYVNRRTSRPFAGIVQDININHYIQTSKYYFQIQAYLEYYSEKQILILESEKLNKDPAGVLREVVAFLEIPDYHYDPDSFTERFHQTKNKKRRTFIDRELSKRTNNRFLLYTVRKMSKPFRKPIERPVVSSAERAMLAAEIAPDVEKLRQFSGIQFSGWSL